MRSGLVTRCNKGKRILMVKGQRERHKDMTAILSEFFYQMRRELRLSLSQFQFNIFNVKIPEPNSIHFKSLLHVFFSIYHMIKG